MTFLFLQNFIYNTSRTWTADRKTAVLNGWKRMETDGYGDCVIGARASVVAPIALWRDKLAWWVKVDKRLFAGSSPAYSVILRNIPFSSVWGGHSRFGGLHTRQRRG
jgi:hypothetical protein